jgi:hypothetical protein
MSWSRADKAYTAKLQVFTFTMTADGSGVFTDEESPDFPFGSYYVASYLKAGGTAPDSSITATCENEMGVDLHNGSGATLDISTTPKAVRPVDANDNAILAPFQGKLTFGIGDNATASAVVDVEIHIAVPR